MSLIDEDYFDVRVMLTTNLGKSTAKKIIYPNSINSITDPILKDLRRRHLVKLWLKCSIKETLHKEENDIIIMKEKMIDGVKHKFEWKHPLERVAYIENLHVSLNAGSCLSRDDMLLKYVSDRVTFFKLREIVRDLC